MNRPNDPAMGLVIGVACSMLLWAIIILAYLEIAHG